jgi:isocitrate dehydrogenase
VQNAWLATIEEGIHTGDVYQEGVSSKKVGTQAFADAVIANLHKKPATLKAVEFADAPAAQTQAAAPAASLPTAEKTLVGVDVYVVWGTDVQQLGSKISNLGLALPLQMIDSKGLKVWPDYTPGMHLTDQFRCRFLATDPATMTTRSILSILENLQSAGIEFVKTEHLFNYDGKPGYSLGQGQ